jgi:hypothetical protein
MTPWTAPLAHRAVTNDRTGPPALTIAAAL